MEIITLEDGTQAVKLEDHNSTLASVRKNATKGHIHTGDEGYKNDMAELNQYRSAKESADLKANYLGDAGFKIKPEYQDDVIKLTGLKGGMEEKEVKKMLTEFTSAPKNKHYLNVDESTTPDMDNAPKVGKKSTTGGGGFFSAFGR